MKRIFLFLATNLAIMLVLGFVVNITGANTNLTANGFEPDNMSVFAVGL